MTVKELYTWAVEHKAEDLDIEIQCRDDGGDYNCRDECYPPCITSKDPKFTNHSDYIILL